MLGKKLGQSRIVGGYIHRPRLHLGKRGLKAILI
jgi:hypothetical protein